MGRNPVSPLQRENLQFVDVPLEDDKPKKNGWQINRKWAKIGLIGTVSTLLVVGVCVGVVYSTGGSNHKSGPPAEPLHGTRHSSVNPILRIAEKIKSLVNQNNEKKEKQKANSEPSIIPVAYTPEHDAGQKQSRKPSHKAEETISKAKKDKATSHEKEALKSAQIIEVNKVVEHDRTPVRKAEPLNPKMKPLKSKQPKAEICETPECAEAAATLVESMDLSTDPCDDFFTFACGGWVDKHPIPPSGATGTFYQADETMNKRLNLIFNTPAAGSDPEPLHMIRTFYQTCVDTDTNDRVGTTPIVDLLQEMGGYPIIDSTWSEDNFDFEVAMRKINSIFVFPILGWGIDADIFNTSRKIIYAGEGTVGPLGAYIMSHMDQYEEVVNSYKTFIRDTSKQLVNDTGVTDVTDEMIDKDIEDLINFESKVAQILENTEGYYLSDVNGLQETTDSNTADQFDWLKFFKILFTGTDIIIDGSEPVYIEHRNFLAQISTVLSETDTRTIANFIGWFWVMEMGQETTYEMRNITFNFEHDIYGWEYPIPRDYICMLQASYDLSFPTARAYVDEFFPASAKTENEQMVEDMRSSFQILLEENTWMKPEDQTVAEEKLAAIEPFVAYPDWIVNDDDLSIAYADLQVESGMQVENVFHVGEYLEHWTLTLFRDPPESVFVMPPTVVNAFYNPLANSITILAGILQPPFYAHNTLAALNYGGIGMVIGHEMTHGFDNSGRQFDKDGNMIPWWSNDTINAFNDRAQCFVDQYDAFHPPELVEIGNEETVNGLQTLGENIADNGGIREAFRAYQIYVERNGEESRLPGLDEFTPNHLFYLGFANVWCEHKNAQAILNQLHTDPHSPGRYRILGPLSNDEDFSKTWNCPAGSPMNRGDDRCLLW